MPAEVSEGAADDASTPEPQEVAVPRDWRALSGYLLMALFVLASSLGAALIYPPAGLVVLGLTSGLYGYLLGQE